MRTTVLAPAHGDHAQRDRERLVELSNAGTAWHNATGSLRGVPGTNWETGRLPAEYRESFHRSTYAVYSYATPIAWLSGTAWFVPDVTYSSTTSRHQSFVRRLAR